MICMSDIWQQALQVNTGMWLRYVIPQSWRLHVVTLTHAHHSGQGRK